MFGRFSKLQLRWKIIKCSCGNPECTINKILQYRTRPSSYLDNWTKWEDVPEVLIDG